MRKTVSLGIMLLVVAGMAGESQAFKFLKQRSRESQQARSFVKQRPELVRAAARAGARHVLVRTRSQQHVFKIDNRGFVGKAVWLPGAAKRALNNVGTSSVIVDMLSDGRAVVTKAPGEFYQADKYGQNVRRIGSRPVPEKYRAKAKKLSYDAWQRLQVLYDQQAD